MTDGHKTAAPEPSRTTAPARAPDPSEPRPTDEPQDARRAPTRSLKNYALTAVLALGFGMLGSYLFAQFFASPPPPAPKDAKDAAEVAAPSNRDLGDQLAKLSDRVDRLNERVAAIPKPEPPPDLSDLQVQVANLAKASERLPPLHEAVARIEGRVHELSKSFEALEDEVHAMRAPSASAAGTPIANARTAPANNEPAAPAEAGNPLEIKSVPEKLASPEALGPAVALFRRQRYKEALEAFTRLEQSNPDDARVWYYAALAHGFVQGGWNDPGTRRLVQKGIECERAGIPPKPIIDSTFEHLSSATGKDWLGTYRKGVVLP